MILWFPHCVFHNGVFGMKFQVLSILKLFALRIEEYANAAPLCKIFTKREKSLFIHTTTTALPTFFFLQEYVVKRRIGWLWDFFFFFLQKNCYFFHIRKRLRISFFTRVLKFFPPALAKNYNFAHALCTYISTYNLPHLELSFEFHYNWHWIVRRPFFRPFFSFRPNSAIH